MLAVGFDPNITISGVLVAIPATIAAVSGLRSNSRTKALRAELMAELQSPNGTTTAVAIQEIKHAVLAVKETQGVHELADVHRFGAIAERQDVTDALVEELKVTAVEVKKALDDRQSPQD